MKIRIIIFSALVSLFTVGCTSKKTIIIAHRGASSVAPENTLAAFQKAIEFGADYFELDVRASKDDSLMIIHDGSIDRTTNGSGSFHDLTYRQLRAYDAGSWFGEEFKGEKMPTLRESLQLALDNRVKVCVEIKDYDKTPRIIALIEEMHAEKSVIIFCFDFDAIATAKKINPKIPVCYLKGEIAEEDFQSLKSIGGEVIGSGSGGEAGIIEKAHAEDLAFWRWTVNSVEEMQALIDGGIDGIITNYPQELVKLLK
jgi:glycerophosphoryl diester phosphodiesterase